MLSVALLTACVTGNDELVVGKWAVENCRVVVDDHTDGTHSDVTTTPADTTYIGYDTVEFKSDGTTRWHMNDRYVAGGMYSSPYRDFNWYVTGDSLIVWAESYENRMFAFEIKTLDRGALIVEQHSTTPEEYGHHHLEQTLCYTFGRVQ